jgi:hypothetical protein
MLAGERAGQGMGALLPRAVYPSDVGRLKDAIDPSMRATDVAVKNCPGVTPAERAAWDAFFAAWVKYRDEPLPWLFGAANLYDLGEAFQAQLAQWQAQLKGRCTVPGPAVVDPHAEDEGQASVIKWAAGAVIVVAIAWGVRSVVR